MMGLDGMGCDGMTRDGSMSGRGCSDIAQGLRDRKRNVEGGGGGARKARPTLCTPGMVAKHQNTKTPKHQDEKPKKQKKEDC